jgi:hypothetical protein
MNAQLKNIINYNDTNNDLLHVEIVVITDDKSKGCKGQSGARSSRLRRVR